MSVTCERNHVSFTAATTSVDFIAELAEMGMDGYITSARETKLVVDGELNMKWVRFYRDDMSGDKSLMTKALIYLPDVMSANELNKMIITKTGNTVTRSFPVEIIRKITSYI
jgi:hypothetical protein